MKKQFNSDCKLCVRFIACNIIEEIKRDIIALIDADVSCAYEIINTLEGIIKCEGKPMRVSYE